MRFNHWILSFSVLLMGLVAQGARAADCISQADMQDIAKSFTQFKKLAGAQYCYDGSQTSGLLQAVMFMRNTQFAVSMPKSTDELFSGTFAKDWWGYFIGRINEFSVETDCPKGVGAFVYGWGGNTMYVCPMMLTDNFTALDRASVFMHEARHIDGHPHITCRRGARAGLNGACDQRMADAGSYAVTVETYAQMAEYATALHPALRAYARSAAVIYADEAFDTPVRVTREEKFLLLTNQKEFYKLEADGSTALERWGDAPELGHIVLRAKFMILYPEDKNLPAHFVFAKNEGELNQQAGELAAEYNSQTPAQRAELADMHMGAQWSARLYRDHLRFTCDPRSSTTTDVKTGGQVPVSVIYPNGYDRAAASAMFVSESGQIMEFGCASGGAYVRASTTKFDQNYKRVQRAGNEVLGLTKDGRLFMINGATSSALQTSADGQIYELVPYQTYQFFDQN